MEQPARDEIARLRALWAQQEEDQKARRDAAQREKLEQRRESI
jgi:hypothetical protein